MRRTGLIQSIDHLPLTAAVALLEDPQTPGAFYTGGINPVTLEALVRDAALRETAPGIGTTADLLRLIADSRLRGTAPPNTPIADTLETVLARLNIMGSKAEIYASPGDVAMGAGLIVALTPILDVLSYSRVGFFTSNTGGNVFTNVYIRTFRDAGGAIGSSVIGGAHALAVGSSSWIATTPGATQTWVPPGGCSFPYFQVLAQSTLGSSGRCYVWGERS